ncbi:MAG: CBS domain-containing protein [Nitrospirae bacterium]|nr:CBS domain-containing protein [Nitrospirota bacterium]
MGQSLHPAFSMDKVKLKSILILRDTTIKSAMQVLNETAEKILFVVDQRNKLIGTVTDGDIRRGIINGLGFYDKIESIMYKNYLSIKSNTPNIEEHAIKLMLEYKIEQIPVLNENGEIINAILWTDVLGEKGLLQTIQLSHNQVVIMAGGKGSRLDPFTRIFPKPLIPIGSKPIVEIIMEKFYRNGFYRFIYTLNYKKEYMKLFLRESKSSYQIDWIEEDDYLGTVGGLFLVRNKIEDSFFLSNCDSLLDINFQEVLAWHKEHEACITIIGCHNEFKVPFGVIELSEGRLKSILEKPTHDYIINTGVYVIEPYAISFISDGECIDMNVLIDRIIKTEKIVVYPIYGSWFDMGQWEEYKKNLTILTE